MDPSGQKLPVVHRVGGKPGNPKYPELAMQELLVADPWGLLEFNGQNTQTEAPVLLW